MDSYQRRYRGQVKLTPEQGGRFHPPVGPDTETVAPIRAEPLQKPNPKSLREAVQDGSGDVLQGYRVSFGAQPQTRAEPAHLARLAELSRVEPAPPEPVWTKFFTRGSIVADWFYTCEVPLKRGRSALVTWWYASAQGHYKVTVDDELAMIGTGDSREFVLNKVQIWAEAMV